MSINQKTLKLHPHFLNTKLKVSDTTQSQSQSPSSFSSTLKSIRYSQQDLSGISENISVSNGSVTSSNNLNANKNNGQVLNRGKSHCGVGDSSGEDRGKNKD
ncbi:hypothetical protein AYI70_g6947 [Smittium culicis]|uniref:Uncharacterized protein n=1 Tax=Smittium culicis TaxID=133412 RepID=A0A1R1XMQ3_9FUNG|nr:hypothetical protein AYI70_g6947 [Smittium culicis]